MKNTNQKYWVFFIFFFAFTACKNNNTLPKNLISKWQIKEVTSKFMKAEKDSMIAYLKLENDTISEDSLRMLLDMEEKHNLSQSSLKLSEDGSYLLTLVQDKEFGTWRLKDKNTIEFTQSLEDTTVNSEIEIAEQKDNKLHLLSIEGDDTIHLYLEKTPIQE